MVLDSSELPLETGCVLPAAFPPDPEAGADAFAAFSFSFRADSVHAVVPVSSPYLQKPEPPRAAISYELYGPQAVFVDA